MTTVRELELEEEVRQLKDQLGVSPPRMKQALLRSYFDIGPSRAKALLMLHKANGGCVSTGQLALALPDPGIDGTHPKAVNVLIHNLRKAIGRKGIKTLHGEGYAITPAGHKCVQDVLDHWGKSS